MPELTYPKPPDIKITLERAKKELGLSFGYANAKIAKELGGVVMAEVGYYVTWLGFEESENEKAVVRYVLFPFDKVLIAHRVSHRIDKGALKTSEKLEISPAFGRCIP